MSEQDVTIARLEGKVDKNLSAIQAMQASVDRLHKALVGNGDPQSIYTRLQKVEHCIADMEDDLRKIKARQQEEAVSTASCFNDLEKVILALKQEQSEWKNKAWGVAATVTVFWTILLVVLEYVFK